MDNINPLTFLGNSSIIDYKAVNQVDNSQSDRNNAQQEFLKMLLEKVYLNNFKLGLKLEPEGEEDDALFKSDTSSFVLEDIFRQQLADQLIENKMFDLGLEENK
ncbi:MAG: hypothetical protein PHV30_07900 [Candidatus Margulisbacteria bacterium]|nr:hypothetical protein [Candidatus Margulisiibacteriota bacterium]